MELVRVSDRILYSMYEEERDRPCLGYIRGDRWSLAVDAGHSDAHVAEFYEALQREGLPLPSLTVVTHWHWDHTFGMHAIHGRSIANKDTNRYLREFKDRVDREGTACFFSLDPSIRKEYEGNRPVIIVPADIEFEDTLVLDPGGLHICLSRSISPHTDDSTFVCVEEEKFLFVGDAISGTFPTWERDRDKTKELVKAIRRTGAGQCLSGHWTVFSVTELTEDLENGRI